MKSITAIVALSIICLNAFAGPEDHISAQTCYSLNTSVPKEVPQRICIENISINQPELTTATLNIYSYFNQNLFANMKLSYLARHNENGFSFRATNVLVDSYQSGCGSAEKSTLQISGRADNDGLAQPEYLDISVKYEFTNDTCHSRLQTEIYNYNKE